MIVITVMGGPRMFPSGFPKVLRREMGIFYRRGDGDSGRRRWGIPAFTPGGEARHYRRNP